MLLLSRFVIQGHSMEPTLSQGQTILASSLPYFFSKPKSGDIVVIRTGHKNRHSGERGTSDSRISSESVRRVRRLWTSSPRSSFGEAGQNDETREMYLIKRIIKVNNGMYFLAGDNKKDSLDSKKLGWIEKKSILGKVIYATGSP